MKRKLVAAPDLDWRRLVGNSHHLTGLRATHSRTKREYQLRPQIIDGETMVTLAVNNVDLCTERATGHPKNIAMWKRLKRMAADHAEHQP